MIGLLGVKVASYHAGLTIKENEKLIKEFRSGADDTVQVLIASDLREYTGLNLQGACRNCVFVTEPQSPAKAQQMIGRIKRFGTKHEWVRVVYIRLKSAFDEYLALQNLKKALAPVGYQISMDFFGRDSLGDEDEGQTSNQSCTIGNIVSIDGDFVKVPEAQLEQLNLPALTEGILSAMIHQMEKQGNAELTEKELETIRSQNVPRLNDLLKKYEEERATESVNRKRTFEEMDSGDVDGEATEDL